ncbi:uncharacterized protein LOC127723090 [Mytilus californianus]|uniref:uncharacterized protein LOC127723090 n=1 Tax=Mytilus californianus TaxID=6549 RepID=UPI002247D12D|nr:uncharacterized protein LOC127723090 [Mytilus californianus]
MIIKTMSFSSIFVVLLFPLLFVLVDSLCNFPCSVRERQTYTSQYGTFKFCRYNSSYLIRGRGNNKEKQECYSRSGPFTVLSRNGNQYQCVKEVSLSGKITWVYESKFKKYKYPPTICSICSPKLMRPVVYVVKGVSLELAKCLKPPPMGCNRPMNCPITDRRDVPCSGCEKYDDGQCCSVPLPPPVQTWAYAHASAGSFGFK